MTKDIQNKFTTFMILLFATVLLLVMALFSDYKTTPSKQIDLKAAKVNEMDALINKQSSILVRMDTIEARLQSFEPAASNATIISNEIEKNITDLKAFFEKSNMKQGVFSGITDNYTMMLNDKRNIKNTTDNAALTSKKLEECKNKLKDNQQELKNINLILGITNKNSDN